MKSKQLLNPFLRPCAILCHSKPNSLTVSENAQIRFILRFILLFYEKTHYLCSSETAISEMTVS